jgi:hypothetical protein
MLQPPDDAEWMPLLDKLVARKHAAYCALGGRSDIDPYHLFFLITQESISFSKECGVNVSPSICVLRPDGTRGLVNLTEVFARRGLIADAVSS